VLETAEPDVAFATLANLTRRFGGNPAFEDFAGFQRRLAGPGGKSASLQELSGATA
jgi:hypothetical protein